MARTAISGAEYSYQMLWQAEIRKSIEGLTLADFLRTMAKRFIFKCRDPMSIAEATELALIEMQALGDEWCDPAYDWSHSGARDMADEFIMDWDHAEAESND